LFAHQPVSRAGLPKAHFVLRGFAPLRPWVKTTAAALLLALATTLRAQTNEASTSAQDLKRLSIEELMNVEVTTVSRQPEPLFTSPSAIQVITGEDIRRSGATSIPEALRLAPNLQVAQIDSRQWAISSRGFNNGLANKLLVMIDGRVVYTPLFAGVFWDVQDTMLEDIDRIEVVSGPGGSLWGANAVNGVINIQTKSARDTQGALVTGGGGSLLNGFGGVRYGGKIGEDLYFRIYGTGFDRDNTVLPNGSEGTNAWYMGQGGFRMDWLPPSGDVLTVQGDGYGSSFEQPMPGDGSTDGQNVLGRYTHILGERSDFTLQTYWDRTRRVIPNSFTETLNTFDVDFQHRFPIGERQDFIWGTGYRLMADQTGHGNNLAFVPNDRNMQLFSAFLQDEIALVPDRVKATIGTKLEHNDFSGFEVSPSGRLAWTPSDRQTIWGAISRPVRSPSRIDTDIRFPANAPFLIVGNPEFDSEKLVAYELGYRIRPCESLSLSFSGFYNDYSDIRSISTNDFIISNNNKAEEWGLEFSGNFQVTSFWRLRGGYTYLNKHVSVQSGSSDLNSGRAEGNDPENDFVLQSMLDLPCHFELDAVFRYVDVLPSPNVPSYVSADLRLAWRPVPSLELSIVGQNLLDNQHPEFGAAATRQEIPRSVYGKVTWRF
jgi:iron complex outermembrane receptor protein